MAKSDRLIDKITFHFCFAKCFRIFDVTTLVISFVEAMPPEILKIQIQILVFFLDFKKFWTTKDLPWMIQRLLTRESFERALFHEMSDEIFG